MLPVLSVLIAVFLYLFSVPALAHFGTKLCKNDSSFTCYKVKSGDTWDKLFPNSSQKDVAMKANRMNTRLYPGLVIAIPTSSYASVMDISPFEKQISAPGEKVIFVSINKLAWGAYDASGSLVNWGPISSAKGYCPDLGHGCSTVKGQFEIYSKQGAGCKSNKFPIGRGGAPMPYCMFFHGGFALHGSYNVPGYNDSHGCVRLFVNDAKWLNQDFVGSEHVPVVIKQM